MSAVAVDDRQRLAELASELNDARAKVQELEHPSRGTYAAGDPDRLRHESRVAHARGKLQALRVEFDEIRQRVADASAEAARLEVARTDALRPGLEAKRSELVEQREQAFGAIETSLGLLVEAVRVALTDDTELERIEYELGARETWSRTRNVIGVRIGRRLGEVGLDDFYWIGSLGLEPLAEPSPRRTTGAQSGKAAPGAASRSGSRSGTPSLKKARNAD